MNKTAVVLVSLVVAACASTPKSDSSQASPTNGGASTAANTAPVTDASVSNAQAAANKLIAETQELQKQSVYFDFDQSVVKPEFTEVIRQQAAFINAHKNDIVTVEGNCDERGSAEYNLALGETRASAAKKSLELLGVPATQIKTTSLGEEKPRLSCREEKCWKENRRDDFVHKLN